MSNLKKKVEVLDRMSEGDLSQRLGNNRKDEIGHMHQALDATSDRLEHKARLARTGTA